MKSLAPAPGKDGPLGDKPPEFWGGNVSAGQVDSASWIYAAASLFAEAACFLGVSSRCMWDASHSLRPLPRAQWFCEGSLPSTLAVGVALCLGCAFVLVCVHARWCRGVCVPRGVVSDVIR